MTTKKLVKRAFTLVELIIVIAIIAILAVTAFLLLTKWLSKARDSSRASNLANIEKSLQISLTDKSSLPKPDNYTLIYASGTSNIVGYQGDFGEGAKDSVGNINSAPKDGDDYFLYYLSNDLRSYQLGALMENETAYNPNTVNAVDYSSRFINVKGNQLGMLFDSSKNPVNKIGLTGVDIQNTTSSYTAYFDNTNKVSGTGFILKSLKGGGNLAYGLVGYWSFDEIGAGNTVLDISKYGNTGYLSGTTLPVLTGGKVGSGFYFNGNASSGFIYVPDNDSLDFKAGQNYSIAFYIKSSYTLPTDNPSTSTYYFERFIQKTQTWTTGFNIAIAYKFDNGLELRNRGNEITYNNSKESLRSKGYKFNDGIWHLILVQRDGKQGKIYIDGAINSIENNIFNGDISNTGNLTIGYKGYNWNGDLYFTGYLDDLRIYNRALTESEVKALYDATK